MKFTNQMAMDCVQSALAAAMDAKKSGIKYTDKQKASVKCHAKDPANCRFHKTGKFAGLKDTEAFSTNLGECSKDDIQDYINEAMEAKGLKGQVSLSTYGDSGDKFLAEYSFPDGTTEEEKLAAKSELENIMFDNGEMLDIKDELASKAKQDTDYTKYAAFKVDGFVNAEESDTVSHPFEQEDIVKPDDEGASSASELTADGVNDVMNEINEGLPDGLKMSDINVGEGGDEFIVDFNLKGLMKDDQADAAKDIASKLKAKGFSCEVIESDNADCAISIKATGEGGGDGSFTEADNEVKDIIADAIESVGGKYENAEWDKDDDGALTLTGDFTTYVAGTATFEKALKDAGYQSASVHYYPELGKYVIDPGEKKEHEVKFTPPDELNEKLGGEGGKQSGGGSGGGEPPKGAIEGEGAEFAKTASAEHKKLVSAAKDILGKCSGMESAGYGEKAILDAAAALKSNLEDLDFFSAKLQKATDTKTKAKCQTYLEETLLDVQNGQEELAALVEKAQSKAQSDAVAKANECDGEVAGFFKENGVTGALSVSSMFAKIMGDGFGGVSLAEFSGMDKGDAMGGFSDAKQAAQKAQGDYESAKDAILVAKQSGDVPAIKSGIENLEKATHAFVAALKGMHESAKGVQTKLKGEKELKDAVAAGVPEETYKQAKNSFGNAKTLGLSKSEFKKDGFVFTQNPDGSLKFTKEETSGAGKGASASAGKAPKPAKPSANASATGYSHATASKEQKGAAVVAKLEKMIAGCKDPAMKAKYEKALAAQKKLFGIDEKAQGGSATGDSKGSSIHFGNKVSAQETLEKSLDKLSITGEPNTASIDHLYADGGGWKVVMDPESGLGDVKAFAESIAENHPDCAVKFDEDMNDGSHFEIQILPKKGI